MDCDGKVPFQFFYVNLGASSAAQAAGTEDISPWARATVKFLSSQISTIPEKQVPLTGRYRTAGQAWLEPDNFI